MTKSALEDIFISQELRYYDVNNIFFDAPINEQQIDALKEILFSINNITQIYFRDNVDIKTIETIKFLLDISPTMNDKNVEKYILNSNNLDMKEIFNINFQNEETWQILFEYQNKKTKLISFSEYKKINNELESILNNLKLDDLSLIEKILKIYDYCKLIELDDEYNNLLSVLKYKKSNKENLINIFQLLLKKVKINSFIGNTINDEEYNKAIIIDVKDDKYNINGIYMFDLLSDYLYKDEVPFDLRTINYNYFCIRLNEYSSTIFNDRLYGILNYLSHDLEYDLEKLNNIKKDDLISLEGCLNSNYINIHNKISSTKELNESTILSIITKNSNIEDIVKENFLSRKDKLHRYNIKIKDT